MLPRQRQHELLTAYVEPFASGRRVVVFGERIGGFGQRLVELGARSVHAFDAGGRSRVEDAPGVILKSLPVAPSRAELDLREGSFDLAVVANAAEIPHIEGLMGQLTRLLGAAGVVVVGAAADGPVGYYELYDLVSQSFSDVAMVGQVPFSGAALAVLGEEGDLEVTVDTQLAGDATPPDFFLAVASHSALELRPYVILQLPSEAGEASEVDDAAAGETYGDDATTAAGGTEPPGPRAFQSRDDDEEYDLVDRAELAAASLRAEVVESQLDEFRSRALGTSDAMRQLQQEIARRDERAQILVEAAQASEAAARALEVRLDEARAAIDARDVALAVRETELAKAAVAIAALEEIVTRARAFEDEARSFQANANALRESAGRGEVAAAAAQALEAELLEIGDAHAAEIGRLEEALRERGRAIQLLERELVRRERIVQELLMQLETAGERETGIPLDLGDEHVDGDEDDRSDELTTTPVPARSPRAEAVAEPEASQGDVAERDPAFYDRLTLPVPPPRPGPLMAEAINSPNAELQAKLEALAIDTARREGELQSLRWRIAELELDRELSDRSSANLEASPDSERDADEPDDDDFGGGYLATDDDAVTLSPPRLAGDRGAQRANANANSSDERERMRDELEMLRKALLQEHQARMAAEKIISDQLAKAEGESALEDPQARPHS